MFRPDFALDNVHCLRHGIVQGGLVEGLGEFGQRKTVSGSLGDLAMTVEGMGSRGDLVGVSQLVMSVIEFVDGLVVAVGEYGGLSFVRIVVQTLLVMFLWLYELGNVFGDSIKVFLLERAGTAGAMLAAARMCLWNLVSKWLLWGVRMQSEA